MNDSYIKPIDRAKWDENRSHWSIRWLVESKFWYKCTAIYESIARAWAYAKFGWDNYDFDFAYTLGLLKFKLERLQNCLLTSNAHTPDKQTTQSLRLAIRLIDRLYEDDYSYFYERHNLKWFGKKHPDCEFEKIEGGSLLRTKRNTLAQGQQEKESDELRAAFAADDALKARDKKWAFAILAKYYEYWWE